MQIVSRARLIGIIRPRLEEMFQLVRARIELERLTLAGRRLVLTGGGSQLEGMVELAEETFGMPARRRPRPAVRVPARRAGPAGGTTAAGLLRWAAEDDGGLNFGAARPAAHHGGAWPGLGNGCARTFEHRAEKARSGGSPGLGTTTEEDVLNDNQPKHAGDHELSPGSPWSASVAPEPTP